MHLISWVTIIYILIFLLDNIHVHGFKLKKCSKNVVLKQVLHGCKETMLFLLLLLSVTGTVLQYFVSHHFTECKGDPRAHHEEVEVLRAPNGLRFLNSV